ncbi:MAG TPA: hypothetical protein DCR17_01255 [Verrucomicrobiales bacterium]|nr:hypothetical protein [Pedosphaera sp.]MBL6843059.1 DUF2934 domain-containing protein [Verrucomicrobiae bacterium]HAO65301.1 hypothetical protein [Verrucomicrobiales bacterium]HBP55118.1 hypothetical protein [Verrucomicrobiales bacterium]HCP39110.1 hypothetical protein [Verrucomicrobiales bacterium]|tara:strand:+ start:472 stop:861 length:390 start_codon:yes stop_codon:yes gene_type:complete
MIATAEYIEKPTYDAISLDAYFLWEKNGRPHGRDEEFWLNAERMLVNQIESLIQRTQKEGKTVSRQKRKGTSKARATNASDKAKPIARKAKATQKARKPATAKATTTTETKSNGKRGKKTPRVQAKKAI